uniref:Sugar phosphate transporter domain-containing protein n=1 Tax=Phaeomonas parva TaxID=124430 RepID=A0A7S1UAC1_9STRA|mmetsp:Transcript_38941/g.121996  ORF Transcript_38941/g.121996 Transcript_38941/m.121996 type:complete len:355 (+) Transcript_38941:141-1205(+)|eukprot:CAMPEP_0118861638 /NCGR_PEP_ID=MMETSP1163-20130328/7107_1 /TAXON_ID=124430 /ORGANISM="Phaeomonas parva, Strain CCMP2877" /LENGTH=354 /DNA_ID=CAMNT_0006795469 /DNA_START=120 /DNA_END=1184 /DNA_ORIENTATION=+
MDYRGYLALLGLALQFGLQPFLSKRYIGKDVLKPSVVMLTESTKIVLCLTCLLVEGLLQKQRFQNLRDIAKSWSLRNALYCVVVPAVLYSIQNILVQSGYQYLDALTFNLLNQCKTIFAAVCLFLVLGKRQSFLQVVALLMLVTAAIILNLDKVGGDAEAVASRDEWFQLGFLPVLLASLISGFTTAFTQKILTEKRNSYLFSMELAVIGIISLLAKELSSGVEGQEVLRTGNIAPLLVGMDAYVMLPVLSSAAGGIVVGLVVKYAGGVRKGFGLVLGILFTGLVQSIVEGTSITGLQYAASGLVVGSMYLHTNYPWKPVAPAKKDDDLGAEKEAPVKDSKASPTKRRSRTRRD